MRLSNKDEKEFVIGNWYEYCGSYFQFDGWGEKTNGRRYMLSTHVISTFAGKPYKLCKHKIMNTTWFIQCVKVNENQLSEINDFLKSMTCRWIKVYN